MKKTLKFALITACVFALCAVLASCTPTEIFDDWVADYTQGEDAMSADQLKAIEKAGYNENDLTTLSIQKDGNFQLLMFGAYYEGTWEEVDGTYVLKSDQLGSDVVSVTFKDDHAEFARSEDSIIYLVGSSKSAEKAYEDYQKRFVK